MSYFLGIDIGTSGTKSLLIGADGRLRGQASASYPLATPRPGWSEQQPERWWEATAATVAAVIGNAGITADEIKGIGLSGQMHGSVFLDKQHKVIRPALLWNDQRTAPQVAGMLRQPGLTALLRYTANPPLTGFTAPKVLWLRENEPENYGRIEKLLLPKDYVRFRLTGEFFTEVSDASGTLLFDVAERTWSNGLLAELDIPPDWLPDCVESPEPTGVVTAAAAKVTGLKAGTAVYGGGGDQAAGAVGTGIVQPGRLSAVLGTSGVIFACSDTPEYDPDGALHTFCHAIPGMWHFMGVTLAAAGSFQWLRDQVFRSGPPSGEKGISFSGMTELAETVDPGSDGLIFLPYLSGERTPHADPHARGVFFGLSLRHSQPHLARAVMEGVCYSLRDCLQLMRARGLAAEQVRASGGGARSQVWRQILASVLDVPVSTTDIDEGPAFGAALLAAVGHGAYPSVIAACDSAISIVDEVHPEPAARDFYARGYELYTSLYPTLRNAFLNLHRLEDARGSGRSKG